MISGFLGKSLQHRMHPKWFLDTLAACKLILCGPWALGLPRVPLPLDPLGSQGTPPMESLGLPWVPSHVIPWAPYGPLPWDPLGSLGYHPMGSLGLPRVPLPCDPLGSQGSPPMGPLGLPRVPSHGVPWAPGTWAGADDEQSCNSGLEVLGLRYLGWG